MSHLKNVKNNLYGMDFSDISDDECLIIATQEDEKQMNDACIGQPATEGEVLAKSGNMSYSETFSDISYDELLISATQEAEKTLMDARFGQPVTEAEVLAKSRKSYSETFSDISYDELLISATQEAEKTLMDARFGQPVTEAEVLAKSRKSGFLVTAPQEIFYNLPEKICATFFNLQEKSVTIRIKDEFSGVIHAEVSETPDADDVCLTLKVPVTALPSSHGSSSSGQQKIEAEVTGRTTDGRPFFEIQKKNIHVTNVEQTKTYIQTDKPIYKAGQTVKFRILTLEYPDLKPHIQKIRRIYVEEPGGRRIQQWNNVDTQAGLAELEMPLSPEPPTGEWTIFAAVGKAKIRQAFEVGEYVLPKFGVTITSQPSYMYKRAQEIAVKICAEYSYGEPVRGAVQANFSLTLSGSLHGDSIVSKQIEDTGSDGCHTFQLGYGEIGLRSLIENRWYTSPELHVDATFTEQGTDVSFVESTDVGYEHRLYTLWIEGPSTFKHGLPYHGSVRLTYPDKYPVNNKDVIVELKNHEGGEPFKSKVFVRVINGGGKFEFTTPLNALNTNLRLDAEVTAHEGEPHEETITANKYLQAWYSPSGSFLYVPPPYANKQSGQEDSIEVDYTVPSGQATMTFHYKIIARGNIVHTGQHVVNNQPSIPAPVIPDIGISGIFPDLGIAPNPRGQFGTIDQRIRKSVSVPPSRGHTTIGGK